MSQARVETFESGANQRGIGTISGHDLAAMKRQLADMEKLMAQYSRAQQPPVASIYPLIPAEEKPAQKPLPAPPEGIVESAENVMATIKSLMARMNELFAGAEVKTHVRARPSFSRTLPGLAKKADEIAPMEDECAQSTSIEPSLTVAPTDEEIKAAHALLDKTIAQCAQIGARPAELIIVTQDERYCVERFRKMIAERNAEITKNFASRFSKLCEKS